MERLRVAAINFWPGFSLRDSLFDLALRESFVVELVEPERADLVFESYFPDGVPDHEPLLQTIRRRVSERWRPRPAVTLPGKRIFFSGEPHNLPVGSHDAVIGSEFIDSPAYYRLPLWLLYCNFFGNASVNRQVRDTGFDLAAVMRTQDALSRPRFACSVLGNPQHLRFLAAERLRRHGEVDLFGRAVSRPVDDKLALMRDYRFNICFENTIVPGYFTEKVLQAKVAGCIPLWYGDPSYRKDFNEHALVNVYEHDFNIERMMDEVDFRRVAETPLISGLPLHFQTGLTHFLERIVRQPSGAGF